MKNLYRKVGEMGYDGLVTDINPAPVIHGATIRKLGAAATLVRGTILAKSSGSAGDGKLVVLGNTAASNETLTADCILCDDVAVGTSDDVTVPVYFAGCFDPDKCTVKSGYTVTEADRTALRERGIIFKAASAAN